MIFTKNKEGVRAIRAMKYKKYVAGKYTRTRAPLARKYTNRIFESKDGTTSMKIVNYIERHNFCWNDLLTKSNRTEIQTYKVEERTFGTPCISKMNCIINQRIEHPFHSPQNVTQEKNLNYDNLEVYIRLERLFVVKFNHLKICHCYL